MKENLQLPEGHPVAKKLGEMVLGALARSPLLYIGSAAVARVPADVRSVPRRWSPWHACGHRDSFERNTGQTIRTDVSATLFLSAPDEYDGGDYRLTTRMGCTR